MGLHADKELKREYMQDIWRLRDKIYTSLEPMQVSQPVQSVQSVQSVHACKTSGTCATGSTLRWSLCRSASHYSQPVQSASIRPVRRQQQQQQRTAPVHGIAAIGREITAVKSPVRKVAGIAIDGSEFALNIERWVLYGHIQMAEDEEGVHYVDKRMEVVALT
eukprot:7283014-Pyramimonas_sp.AAC.2